MTAAWSCDLPAGEKLVLLALADCANDEGHCWPGIASLCRKTGRCKRSLQESLRLLDKAGHITRTENPGKGMNYVVHPVAKSAPVAADATGSKKPYRPVAKSAPKPSRTVKTKATALSKRLLPDDWEPVEFGAGTQSRKIVDSWTPDERARQLEAFKAHHSGNSNRWNDWQKAWSTWALNSVRFERSRGPPVRALEDMVLDEARRRAANG